MLQFLAALGVAAVFVTVVLALLHLAIETDGALHNASRERRWP